MARRPLTMATVKPIRIAGGQRARMGYATAGAIQLQLDPKQVAKTMARLNNFRDAPLHVRMDKATKAAAELLEKPMQVAAPVGQYPAPKMRKGMHGPPKPAKKGGTLKRSIDARTVTNRDKSVAAGLMKATGGNRVGLVGPVKKRAPHRHLVIQGHRIVTRGGRDTGRRTRPNGFVDAVARRHQATALRLMQQQIVTAGLNQGLGNAIVFGKPATRKV